MRAHIVAVVIVLIGCRQEMADQPRYEPYELAPLLEDSLSMRRPVAGTVPRDDRLRSGLVPREEAPVPPNQDSVPTGRLQVGVAGFATSGGGYPFPVTERVLHRGRQRFDIYCAPCHGRAGYGAGIIVQRGLRKPPSFHTDRLRDAPPDHFYAVITEGYGAMFSYASRVEPVDRWAIAAYIEALQLSQHAEAALLPDTMLTRHAKGRD